MTLEKVTPSFDDDDERCEGRGMLDAKDYHSPDGRSIFNAES